MLVRQTIMPGSVYIKNIEVYGSHKISLRGISIVFFMNVCIIYECNHLVKVFPLDLALS